MAVLNIAYEAPDNHTGYKPSAKRPIDLVHLATQTHGDKSLEVELLQIFAKLARQSMRDIIAGTGEDPREIAHRLKGSARAIGAFSVSDAADLIETSGADAGRIARLNAAVIDAENFIASLIR